MSAPSLSLSHMLLAFIPALVTVGILLYGSFTQQAMRCMQYCVCGRTLMIGYVSSFTPLYHSI